MIIVTGANGFIGSAIVWELNQKGVTDIICVDTIPLTLRPQPLAKRSYNQFILKDDIWKFLASSEAQYVDWIIHMGACSSTTETNWEFLNENNFSYSKRLFDWCAKMKRNIIYASSAATYGNGELGFDDRLDSHKLKPLNLYGESKVLMDRFALDLLSQNKVQEQPSAWYGLKFFNVFGPNEYLKEGMASVAYKACHQIKEKGRLGLFKSYNSGYKDGEQKRDFIYVKEVTRWICELMATRPLSGVYNMGSGKARSWLDLANSVFSALDKSAHIDWLEMPDNIRNQYQYFTEANMSKWLSRELSEPKWTLEIAIDDYVKNYLKQGDLWL